MYDHIYNNMCYTGVIRKPQEATWMDSEGNVVEDESQAYGCRVTHNLIHPEMCAVGDEIGGNISMSGTKLLCERGTVPQKKPSNKDKHFTVMGFTLLSVEQIMCILIMPGKRVNFLTEMGFDSQAQFVRTQTDPDFFTNNMGPGKVLPAGPACHFNDKEVPSFTRRSKKLIN